MSGILVHSFSATQPEELIKNIMGINELPKSEQHFSHIKSYPWHLETKYYTVDLFLHTVEDIVASPEFVDTIEALVIHFDPLEEKSFGNVAAQLPVLDGYDAEVQIIVCESLNQVEDNISNKYLDWCVKNKFELVELCSQRQNEADDDGEEEDDYEISGYRRILGALQAHFWPNLKMKDKNDAKLNFKAPTDSSFSLVASADAASEKSSIEKESTRTEKLDALLNDEFLQSAESGDSSLSFEELFQKFSEMKDKASTLTGEERKQYAEKVTIAFWKAIGGDEEEIAGLSGED